MQQTLTTNQGEIREWAAGRGGAPAMVVGSESELRFDWGDDDTLERISWDDFFAILEEHDLAFAHIEEDDSSVYEFVPRGMSSHYE